MAYKLGVLILHGMGSQTPNYADPMIKELEKRIKKHHINPDDIRWESAYVAGVLQGKQTRLWRELSRNHKLRWAKLRQFIIHSLGDAVAYQPVEARKRINVHAQIHKKILGHLKRLRSSLRAGLSPTDSDRPFVVLSHSLGCFMISNYIWDRQHNRDATIYGGNAFLEMKTLAGIVTFGCNIPLFSLAYEKYDSITFPDKVLPRYFPQGTPKARIRAAAQWLNFYDRDDVLGYPLKPLSASYKATVTRDIQINVGGILSSWNPRSHSEYWTDNDFTKPVARFLAGILKLL